MTLFFFSAGGDSIPKGVLIVGDRISFVSGRVPMRSILMLQCSVMLMFPSSVRSNVRSNDRLECDWLKSSNVR